jgi:hypothetical protein
MLGTHRPLILVSTLAVISVACNNHQTTTDLQLSRMDETKRRFASYNADMIDNAILHDMSVADIHFIAHTGELSGIGEARLNRMAKLLHTYGGTVRYETTLDDEVLMDQRLAHVREYLALTGCDMERVEVTDMMSGGRGIPGDEAVAKFLRGTAKPKKKAGPSPITVNVGGGSSSKK